MSTMTASEPSGLTVSPFTDNPDTLVFVETEMHRRAVAQARFGIEQGSGLVVITGELGSGKSAVLNRAAFLCTNENTAIVRLSANEIEGESLEAVILRALRASEPGIDPDARIEDALLNCRDGGITPALLIDDADDLGDQGFETLHRIVKLEKDGDPLFRIVIAGRPALRSLFYRDDMAGLRRMTAANSQLGSLSREDVEFYVDARIRSAGFSSEITPTVEFFDALAEQSGGNPGRINKLAGRAITQAGLAGRSELFAADLDVTEADTVERAADNIEDAEVVSTQTAGEVAASNTDPEDGGKLDHSKTVTVTDLNAAIEQLGKGQAISSASTQAALSSPTEDSEFDAGMGKAQPRQKREIPDDVDVWEPASVFTPAEEEQLDGADMDVSRDDEHPVVTDMLAHVNDLREQIDSLRNTIDTLRKQAERLGERRKAAREKLGGRIDTIRTRLDDIRRGE